MTVSLVKTFPAAACFFHSPRRPYCGKECLKNAAVMLSLCVHTICV